MDKTTTPVDGVAPDVAVSNTPEATQPTPPSEEKPEAVESQETAKDTDTSSTDQPVQTAPEEDKAEDITEWAKKKGLPMDDPVKLATMYRDAEKKMHEATQEATQAKVEPPEEVPLTGNEAIDEVVARQNETDLKLYVRDWFDANPDMRANRPELIKIANERPWLQNMDDVKAHFLADPSRAEQLQQEGGRKALTDLAQKQQAIPPSANATNSAVYESSKITPENVDELVAKNTQEWYNTNRDAIRQASFGITPR